MSWRHNDILHIKPLVLRLHLNGNVISCNKTNRVFNTGVIEAHTFIHDVELPIYLNTINDF